MNLFNLNEANYINQNRSAAENVTHIARFIRFGAGPEDFLNFDYGINPRAEQLGLVLSAKLTAGSATKLRSYYINGKNIGDIADRNGLDLNTKEGVRKAIKLAFGGTVKVDFDTGANPYSSIVIQAPGDFVWATAGSSGVTLHRVTALNNAVHEREYSGSNVGHTGVINGSRVQATYYPNTSDSTNGGHGEGGHLQREECWVVSSVSILPGQDDQ